MRDALDEADHDSVVSTAVINKSADIASKLNDADTAGVATATTVVDAAVEKVDKVVDHTAAVSSVVSTDVPINAVVDKSAAVAAEEDIVDQCYKGIAVLDAYHKGVPVGKPVPNYLISTVKKAFNSRMPSEQRKLAKDRYPTPKGVPFAKGPRINDVVRRNMSRFNKDLDDDQRDIQSSFSSAIVPILYAMNDINADGDIDRKKVTEHLATSDHWP
jgi:hypothetical protein